MITKVIALARELLEQADRRAEELGIPPFPPLILAAAFAAVRDGVEDEVAQQGLQAALNDLRRNTSEDKGPAN